MGILTISRELGAGETTIAPALAARLGWCVADQSLLNRKAKITGVSLPHAAHWDEYDPTFVERLHGQGPEFAAFLKSSRHTIQDWAQLHIFHVHWADTTKYDLSSTRMADENSSCHCQIE